MFFIFLLINNNFVNFKFMELKIKFFEIKKIN